MMDWKTLYRDIDETIEQWKQELLSGLTQDLTIFIHSDNRADAVRVANHIRSQGYHAMIGEAQHSEEMQDGKAYPISVNLLTVK